MVSSWLNAYRPSLETATPAELAVELCDAALVRLQPDASPDLLQEAQQAIHALPTMVNPAAAETAANLSRLRPPRPFSRSARRCPSSAEPSRLCRS